MSIFNRLFGSNKNINKPAENQQKHQEIKENKVIRYPDISENNPPLNLNLK
jgi:hypothetical protein